MRDTGDRSWTIALLLTCLFVACATGACSDDSSKSTTDMLADQDEDLIEDLIDARDSNDVSDSSDLDASDASDGDSVNQDGDTGDDTTDQDTVDADQDQDIFPQCSDMERLCGGICAQCPSADGVSTYVCNGTDCEVEFCEVGYEACATGCCLAGPVTIASDGDEVDHHSLALTSAGVPHVAYRSVTSTEPSALGHAWWDGESWQTEILEGGPGMSPSGIDPEIVIDSSDTPHIAYLGELVSATFAPMYAVKDGVNWSFELVRSTSAGFFVSLALDSAELPHVAYHSRNDDQLIVGSRDANGTWSHDDIVVSPNTDQFGRYVSLAIDSADTLHLIAADASFGDLEYFTPDNSVVWDETQVFGTGERSDLAVDGSDFIHIVFYDDDAGVPRYARPIGASTWMVEQLGTCSDCGKHIAIALDSQERPHVLYSQAQSSDLVYVHWDGQEWQRQSISSTGPIGPECDIALDAQDRAHLTFRNFNDGTLEYLLVP